jgi:hypothetical protein
MVRGNTLCAGEWLAELGLLGLLAGKYKSENLAYRVENWKPKRWVGCSPAPEVWDQVHLNLAKGQFFSCFHPFENRSGVHIFQSSKDNFWDNIRHNFHEWLNHLLFRMLLELEVHLETEEGIRLCIWVSIIRSWILISIFSEKILISIFSEKKEGLLPWHKEWEEGHFQSWRIRGAFLYLRTSQILFRPDR